MGIEFIYYPISTNLDIQNGDAIDIKFAIKLKYQKEYQFSTNFDSKIEIFISGLEKIEVDETIFLKASLFTFLGTSGLGTINIRELFYDWEMVGTSYIKVTSGGNMPANDAIYSPTVPNDLSNGDTIYIKFYIIEGQSQENYKFPSNFVKKISIAVLGLS